MKPKKYPTDYASGKAPPNYKCSVCKIHGVKLWRQYQTFADQLELMCAECAIKDQSSGESSSISKLAVKGPILVDEDGRHEGEHGKSDQIGWLVPAVPDEEGYSYWGYTSVPQAGVNWWKQLPTKE